MSTKSDLLKANATSAIDAIMNDPELDDDAKEEILEELHAHIEDQTKLLSGDDDDDDDEDDEDEIEEDDE
jgi:hypothetical protein